MKQIVLLHYLVQYTRWKSVSVSFLGGAEIHKAQAGDFLFKQGRHKASWETSSYGMKGAREDKMNAGRKRW